MRSLLPFRRRHGRKSRGQSVVEFALVMPVFMLLLLVAVDFGRLFFSYVQISNATREGAAYAAAAPTDLVGIRSAVARERNSQSQRGENSLTVTASCFTPGGATIACASANGGSGPGNTVTVATDEPFTFFTPLINGLFSDNLHLTTTASSVVLGYASGGSGTPPTSCNLPTASFTIVITGQKSLFADPTASTPNSGTCNISGMFWDWGDGLSEVGTATGNPHTYSAAGTYTVRLDVTNQAGTSFATQVVSFSTPTASPTCARPTATFTYTRSGKTYTYRDTSTVADPVNCPITDWLWTFTDQSGLQSNAQNPAPVTYGNNASHPVTLKVTNAAGSTTVTHS
jgi:Flp pilus assembly protein TadG